jgi:hypothetical protein
MGYWVFFILKGGKENMDKFISKIQLNGELYQIKDAEARQVLDSCDFGDNNTLNEETIGVFGNNNIIGCKAYRILKYRVDEANNKTYVQVDGNGEIASIPVGTPVTLIFDETATRVANTVDSITYAENATEIVLDKAWVEYHYENTDVRMEKFW